MSQIISITEAKQKFLALARRNKELGESFIIVKDSEPISALIPFEAYESLLETLDIIESEPNIVSKLEAAKREIKKGQYKIWKGAQGSRGTQGTKKKK